MNTLDTAKKRIYQFLSNYIYEFTNENSIELEFIRLNGLSNSLYLVKIIDNNLNELKYELIYREFGAVGELIDRKTEKEIIDFLSLSNLTPKILEAHKDYRIEEYISNSDTLKRDLLEENFIIDKIIDVLIAYSLIAPACLYQLFSFNPNYENWDLDSDSMSITYSKSEAENKKVQEKTSNYEISYDFSLYNITKHNIYDKCQKLMYNKSKKNYDVFNSKIESNIHLFNSEDIFKIKKFQFYMDNYNTIFTNIFPKNGVFSLSHNDVHSLNLLLTETSDQILVIDHEYASLNLAGIDIVNYLIEFQFNYTRKTYPFHDFDNKKLYEKFERNYEIFLNFMNKYEKIHNEKEGFSCIKAKEKIYYFELICIISLFWFIYSVMYIDFDALVEKKSFNYLLHACDRIENYEYAYNEIQRLKEEELKLKIE
jgi:thiamine kinase-like enzyme